jgi:hypothetical protein
MEITDLTAAVGCAVRTMAPTETINPEKAV